jgi:hypothetical protein
VTGDPPGPGPGPEADDRNPSGDSPDSIGDEPAAEFEPVVIANRSEAEALAAPRTPELRDYDPAPEREQMRNWISKGVLLAAAIAGVGVILNGAFGGSNEQAVSAVFTGLVGLVGTVVGFYFGGKDKTG